MECHHWLQSLVALLETRDLGRLDHFHSHLLFRRQEYLLWSGPSSPSNPPDPLRGGRSRTTHIKVGVGEELPGRGIGDRRRDGVLELAVIPVLQEELPRGNGGHEEETQRMAATEWVGVQRRRGGGTGTPEQRLTDARRGGGLEWEGRRRKRSRFSFFSRRRVRGTETEETVRVDRVGRANWSFDQP